jgi:AP-3 complex subunit beta
MATGGYNASFEENPMSFGSNTLDESAQNNGRSGGGESSAPLVGIDYKRNEELTQMLDSNKDGQKLDAMKMIIGMIAKGRDCTNLFPAVVKNVVSKNPEIKKLVFVYLVRYAEEQQDLALLSISTFQKSLKVLLITIIHSKSFLLPILPPSLFSFPLSLSSLSSLSLLSLSPQDPNQLIRASALRVLSSIRVPIIVPIMMLAIKDVSHLHQHCFILMHLTFETIVISTGV